MTEETKRAVEWIVSRDTGLSSKTIWAVMMGSPGLDGSFPLDNDDFGRCYRLLARMPEWRDRLPEVAEACPAWQPLVERWDELTALYEADLQTKGAYACGQLLRALWPECMRADGLVETARGVWQRRM